jgi:hypothetical protein
MRTAQQSVWQDSFLLQRIFSYIGPGRWLLLSTVSKLYKESYEKVAEVVYLDAHLEWKAELCTAKSTLLTAAFTSAFTLKLAVAYGLPIRAISNRRLQHIAGKRSSLSTLQVAHKLKLPLTHHVTIGVARSGCVEKLEWLYAEQRKYLPVDIRTAAISEGYIEVLKWYKQKGGKLSKSCVIGAAHAGRTDVLEFLHAEGFAWHRAITAAAARSGSVDTLRWLLQQGCPVNLETICNRAATSGSVGMVRFTKQLGGTLTEETMRTAAHRGSLPLCQYLLSEGCPWEADACTFAAHSGKLHVVRWLHEHGCPWHIEYLLHFAAAGGSINVLEYMQQQPEVVLTAALLTDMLNAAGANSKLAAAQWVRQQGAEWPAVLRVTSKAWSGDVLAWARAEGCTSPTT